MLQWGSPGLNFNNCDWQKYILYLHIQQTLDFISRHYKSQWLYKTFRHWLSNTKLQKMTKDVMYTNKIDDQDADTRTQSVDMRKKLRPKNTNRQSSLFNPHSSTTKPCPNPGNTTEE